eukprot:scaffold273145_cov27-Tisochrysis_lutea.AAC.5
MLRRWPRRSACRLVDICAVPCDSLEKNCRIEIAPISRPLPTWKYSRCTMLWPRSCASIPAKMSSDRFSPLVALERPPCAMSTSLFMTSGWP